MAREARKRTGGGCEKKEAVRRERKWFVGILGAEGVVRRVLRGRRGGFFGCCDDDSLWFKGNWVVYR